MRDTPCGSQIFPLIITQANCFLHSSSLQERGLGGGEAFFFYAKREDVKSTFTSSLFTYILFLVPLLPAPHYVHIHKDIVVSAPSCVRKSWEESVG